MHEPNVRPGPSVAVLELNCLVLPHLLAWICQRGAFGTTRQFLSCFYKCNQVIFGARAAYVLKSAPAESSRIRRLIIWLASVDELPRCSLFLRFSLASSASNFLIFDSSVSLDTGEALGRDFVVSTGDCVALRFSAATEEVVEGTAEEEAMTEVLFVDVGTSAVEPVRSYGDGHRRHL